MDDMQNMKADQEEEANEEDTQQRIQWAELDRSRCHF